MPGEVEDSVERRPLASLVASTFWSCEGELLECLEGGSRLGSSTNPGGWCDVGDEEAVALRISFSV